MRAKHRSSTRPSVLFGPITSPPAEPHAEVRQWNAEPDHHRFPHLAERSRGVHPRQVDVAPGEPRPLQCTVEQLDRSALGPLRRTGRRAQPVVVSTSSRMRIRLGSVDRDGRPIHRYTSGNCQMPATAEILPDEVIRADGSERKYIWGWKRMRRLVLFDIDGTILDAGGTAAVAFRAALLDIFGTSPRKSGYSFGGKTDPQIAVDLLSHEGFEREAISAQLPQLWANYLARLRRECVPRRVSVYPGVEALLSRLHQDSEAVLGLLTGNLQEGAWIKLTAAGLDCGHFVTGAFGSDDADRRNLPTIAIERAERAIGRRFSGKEIVIVGDTPHDISCGAHLGVRTIAVATGSYSENELRDCRPDYLFTSLEETDEVCAAIFA
ncbi:hypothetical protein BH23GEM6_BH23GEM6_23600 [soil metagenome]